MNCRVYVCANRHGHLKIGCSTDPKRRVKLMGKNLSLLYETDVIERAQRVEYLAQRVMALHAQHLWGEWFEGSLSSAKSAIEIALRQDAGSELVLVGKVRRIPPHRQRRIGVRSGVEPARAVIIRDLVEAYERIPV